MIRKTFSFQSENKDFGQEVILVLSFLNRSFCFICLRNETNEVLKIEDFVFEPSNRQVDSFVDEFVAFSNDYTNSFSHIVSRYVIAESLSTTVVPVEIYEENQQQFLHNSLHGDQSKLPLAFLQSNKIPNSEIVVIEQIPIWQKLFMERLTWNNCLFISHTFGFLSGILKNRICSTGLFINVSVGAFTILLLHDDQIQLINKFEFVTAADFCYYAAGAAKALGHNPSELQVYLSGEVLPGSEIVILLEKYFAGVFYLAPINVPVPPNLPIHCYYTQLSML